jgi:hypothetical protein
MQIYLQFSEVQPIFDEVKGSANRVKMQIYLQFSFACNFSATIKRLTDKEREKKRRKSVAKQKEHASNK